MCYVTRDTLTAIYNGPGVTCPLPFPQSGPGGGPAAPASPPFSAVPISPLEAELALELVQGGQGKPSAGYSLAVASPRVEKTPINNVPRGCAKSLSVKQ